MAYQAPVPLVISSLRGGLNDTDPPNALPNDACTVATNVEFFASMLGERRNGCGPLDITSSDLDDETQIVHISQWFPTNDVTAPEFIVIGATPTTSVTVAKRTAGTWSEITPGDAIGLTVPDIYNITAQSLNGKDFFAYHSAVDRMHVWDGTTWRRTGLAEPAAPTAANAGGGTFSGTRYYRVRYLVKSGATILRRSEPSPTLTFVPSGTGASVTVTKPTTISEGETDWELEASTDNVLFYILATQAVGTTTYSDATVFATGYSAGVLSENIGTYLLLPAAEFLTVDGDRLIFAGHFTDLTKKSQVGWTPVQNDPGKGNDERLPLAVNNTKSLDNYDGGPLTGIASSVFGVWYAFKWNRIYQMTRTGDVTNAYDDMTISSVVGALKGSIVRGIDETGAVCVYFTDSVLGPCRIGPQGLQKIVGIRNTWGRVNTQAANVVVRGVYYPFKQQVIWLVAVDGSNVPNFGIKVQVSEIRSLGEDRIGRGISLMTGRITEATAMGVLTEVVSINGTTSLSQRPFVGLGTPDYVQRTDTESNDAGVAFVATIRTKPFMLAGLMNNWGAMTASLLATANAQATLSIRLIRDMAVETSPTITTSLAPVAAESLVIKDLNDLVMSGATTMQIEFSDA